MCTSCACDICVCCVLLHLTSASVCSYARLVSGDCSVLIFLTCVGSCVCMCVSVCVVGDGAAARVGALAEPNTQVAPVDMGLPGTLPGVRFLSPFFRPLPPSKTVSGRCCVVVLSLPFWIPMLCLCPVVLLVVWCHDAILLRCCDMHCACLFCDAADTLVQDVVNE